MLVLGAGRAADGFRLSHWHTAGQRISTGPTPWFWGINGAAGVLAASVAIVISIAFDIDQTLRIGAACYLLVGIPAMVLLSAGTQTPRAAPQALQASAAGED